MIKNFDDIAKTLRTLPSSTAESGHLDDDTIAAIAEGLEPPDYRAAIAHFDNCSECRTRLAAVSAILDDADVKAELRRLQPTVETIRRSKWTPARIGLVGTLAAAAVMTIVVLGPRYTQQNAPPVHRESAITTTAAPVIVSPSKVLRAGDSLRWTRVPLADLYRVRVWNADGNVALAEDTPETTIVFPPRLMVGGARYFLVVKARIGWNRWVSSEFVEFTADVPRN